MLIQNTYNYCTQYVTTMLITDTNIITDVMSRPLT